MPQGRVYFPWMAVLAGLFVLRVAGQLVQAVYEVPFLPPFEAWQGMAMPYAALLSVQAAVIVVAAVVLRRVRADSMAPRRWKHLGCYVVGGVYFAAMAFRLAAGQTFLAEYDWFAKGLPAFFHLVLASFILLLGRYLHGRAAMERSGGYSGAGGLTGRA